MKGRAGACSDRERGVLPPLGIQCVSALSKIASSESAERYSSEISGPSEHAQCLVHIQPLDKKAVATCRLEEVVGQETVG